MFTCSSLLHKLSWEFWPFCIEYSTSRVKTNSYFKDQPVYRCEVQGIRRLNYFFDIFYNLSCDQNKSLQSQKPILQLLSKMNFFAYNLLAESPLRKHIICSSRNKLFHHNGMFYRSWLVFTVCLLLLQRTSFCR